ncbi:MAG: GIY-YIG nuclease family protein [Myxococcota bacterium]
MGEADARPDDWFVYLLRCRDGSLYAGISNDVPARIQAHEEGRGARYTRGRGPFELVGSAGPFTRGDALRHERALKRQSQRRKPDFLDGLALEA